MGALSSAREQIIELAKMGFDLCILPFSRFQEMDDVRLFMDEAIPAFK